MKKPLYEKVTHPHYLRAVPRAKINPSISFKEFLNEIRNICLENYKHQDYPLNELISKLNIQRDTK